MPLSADFASGTVGSTKDKEGAAEFLNFPDPSLYMIGFKYRQTHGAK